MSIIKAWENGTKTWNLTEESRRLNAEMCAGYGRDALTFSPETTMVNNMYYRQNEGPISHGYPATSWL